MDSLLRALQLGKRDLVGRLAADLFITKTGDENPAQINEFERYAPCKIRTQKIDVGGNEMIAGKIIYNQKEFIFG